MKNQIFKVLSLLLVLTLLATTCMHSAWSVAAADETTALVSPNMLQANIDRGTMFEADRAKNRISTMELLVIDNYENIFLNSNYQAIYHVYNAAGTWIGNSNGYTTGKGDSIALFTTAQIKNSNTWLNKPTGVDMTPYYFRLVLKDLSNNESFPVGDFNTTNLKLTLKINSTTEPTMAQGTLDYKTASATNLVPGSVQPLNATTRIYTQQLLRISDYQTVACTDASYKFYYVVYDANGNYLGKQGWNEGEHTKTAQQITNIANGATYFRILLGKKDDSQISPSTYMALQNKPISLTPVETELETPDYSEYYVNRGQGLKNTFAKLNKGEAVNVVYMGGSITNGTGSSDYETTSWRALTNTWLNKNKGSGTINTFNAAYGDTCTLFGAYRVGAEVLPMNPDLVFIEFSINNRYNSGKRNYTQDDAKMQLESIIRALRKHNSKCDIVIVLTTDQNDATDANKGVLHAYAKIHDELAQVYNIPSIYVGLALESKLTASTAAAWAMYSGDTVHPNDAGYKVYADVVAEYLTTQKEAYSSVTEVTSHAEVAQQSATLIDPDKITFIDADEDLVATSNSLGGTAGVTYGAGCTNLRNIFNGGIKLATDSDVLKFKFTGTELSMIEYQLVTSYSVSIDGGEYKTVTRDGVKPLILATALEDKEHEVAIKVTMGSATACHIQGFFAVSDRSAVEPDEPEVSDEYYEFEYGTLNGTNGSALNEGGHLRIRTANLIPIDEFQSVEIGKDYQMYVFIYGADKELIKHTSDWVSTVYTTEAMKTYAGNDAKFFKIYLKHVPDEKEFTEDEDNAEHPATPAKKDVYFRPKDAEQLVIHEEYFVSANGNDSNEGTSQGAPLASINKAIQNAKKTYSDKEGQIIINLIGNGVSWTGNNGKALDDHAFKVLIKTADGQAKATISKDGEFKDYHMGGDVEFKNVNIAIAQYNIIFHNNHNVTYNEDVRFVDKVGKEVNYAEISLGVYASHFENGSYIAKEFSRDIKAEIKIPVYKIYLSNKMGPSVISGDMHVHYDCAQGKPTFVISSEDAGSTSVTYHAGVDMIIENATSVKFEGTNDVVFGRNGFLQVLNNASTGEGKAVIPIDSQVALDNASAVWIVHNELSDKERVGFTGHKGIYTISDTTKVYAFKDTEQVTESYDGQINIGTPGAGIYTLKDEGKASIPTYFPSTELNTIAKLIEQAVSDDGKNDRTEKFTEVKIDLSNCGGQINFGTFTKGFTGHKFKVIVTSEAITIPKVVFEMATAFMGDMRFNNVELDFPERKDANNVTKASMPRLYLDGHSLEVTETSTIDTSLRFIFGGSENQSETYTKTQNIILDAKYGNTDQSIYLGSDTADCTTTYNGDVNVIVNHAASRPTIDLSRKNAQTTYNGDLNINAKRYAKVVINYIAGGVIKGSNSKVQIIHDDVEKPTNNQNYGLYWKTARYEVGSNAESIDYDDIKIVVDGEEENFVDYHITDKSFGTGCIDCTETPGEYVSNTEFIISAFYNNNLNSTPIESIDEELKLTQEGEWTLTTTNYFEDFKGVTKEEFEQTWNDNNLIHFDNNGSDDKLGTWQLNNEKVYLSSSGYLPLSGNIITNRNIKSRNQYISIDFDSSDLNEASVLNADGSGGYRSTKLTDAQKDNARDNGAGIALYARLSDDLRTGYELKVTNNRIILTKRKNGATHPSVKYTPIYLVDNKYATKDAYDAEVDEKGTYDMRFLIDETTCDFDLSNLKSYTKYNRFPESYDEGNSITFNDTHIYRLGMSVTDYEENGNMYALVRILLLDVTTNTLVVDETFKDIKNVFEGENFGFGLYGSAEMYENGTKTDRFCHANFDKVWFSTERFRGGDQAEFNDINYDGYFDVRDLVRTYEYMGGASARINFNAADRDFNGYITTSDESEIRKEILHDGDIEFKIKGQIDDEAKVLRDKITNIGVGTGSGVKPVTDGYNYYPDLNGEPLKDSNGNTLKLNNAYYVSTSAKEPEDKAISGMANADWWEFGDIDIFGSADIDSNTIIRTKYFLKITDNLVATVNNEQGNQTATQLQCFLYDKDFNFIAKTVSKNGVTFSKANLNSGTGGLTWESGVTDDKSILYMTTLAEAAKVATYVKFRITRNSGSSAVNLNDTFLRLSGDALISGYDYHKNSTGKTPENPWTFRQFQLYGDAFPLTKDSNDRPDPLKVISSGDVVMFERGKEFTNIEHLRVISLQDQPVNSYAAFTAQDGVVYGAYGTGAKPMLNASAVNYTTYNLCPECQKNPANCTANNNDLNDNVSGWEKLWHKSTIKGKEHVYWCDVRDVVEFTDLRDNNVLNVIFDGGEKIGVRKFYSDDLHTIYKDGQYTTDQAKGRLYLYCQYYGDDKAVSPNQKYNTINLTRCMYGAHGHRGNDNYVFDNINFHGFGSGAFKGPGKSKNITIQNCEVGFSGGMMYLSAFENAAEGQYIGKKPADIRAEILGIQEDAEALEAYSNVVPVRLGLRYGNGVEMWQSSEGFEIKNSYIYHTFDSAVSPQGDGQSTGNYNGFKVMGNLFEFNNADIEYFDDIDHDGTTPTDKDQTVNHTVFTNVEIEQNIFRFTSFGWGTRESDKIRGIQGVLRMDFKHDAVISFDFENNKIDSPGMEIFRILNQVKSDNNYHEDYRYYLGDQKIDKTKKWVTQNGTKGNYSEEHLYGDKDAKVSGNKYYFNAYIRNYAFVATGYFAPNEDPNGTWYGPDRQADDEGILHASITAIDTSDNSEVYWYRDLISKSN